MLNIDKIKEFIKENIWWNIQGIWEVPMQKIREAKWFIQRGKKGYSDFDIWSFDSYLCEVLAGGLKKLAEESMGYPGYGEMDTFKKWQNALKLNTKRFQDVVDYENFGWENDKDWKKGNILYQELPKAFEFISKWFNSLWD